MQGARLQKPQVAHPSSRHPDNPLAKKTLVRHAVR